MSQEIQKTPAEMIQAAMSAGADLDKLEKLLELQMRWEANEARKVFAVSFSTVQHAIMAVIKTKTNSQTHSKYADLSDVIESAKPVYTKEGFSVIFYEGATPVPEHTRICADVLHSSGHKETYWYDVPIDGVGIKGNANMTKIHAKASSVSYARRYLMCMIWNITTADDDGNAGGNRSEFINQWQVEELQTDIETKSLKVEPLLKYMGVSSLQEIMVKDFQKAKNALKVAKEGNK